MSLIIDPVDRITTPDATDLATALTLVNSLKSKVNDEVIEQFNLSLEKGEL